MKDINIINNSNTEDKSVVGAGAAHVSATNVSAANVSNSDIEKLIHKPAPAKKERLLCLDVLRGLTMVGMIMVDSMGDFDHVIWPLDETKWDGLSTADCIFPCFLFIMGLAVPLALKREDRYNKSTWWKIIKRFFNMFLIGLIINFQIAIP